VFSGVGHLLGLDVRLLPFTLFCLLHRAVPKKKEELQLTDERTVKVHDVGGLPEGKSTNPLLRYLRLRVPLEEGFVVTVEPGFVSPSFLRPSLFFSLRSSSSLYEDRSTETVQQGTEADESEGKTGFTSTSSYSHLRRIPNG